MAKNRKHRRIQAAGKIEAGLQMLSPCDIHAAEGEKKERRFSITAYTGGPLQQSHMGWGYPVVVDNDGWDLGAGVFPMLDNHGPSPYSSDVSPRAYVVGQSDSAKIVAGELKLTGKMIEVNKAAQDIIAMADKGFKWQASIGARSVAKDFIGEGSTVEVNGTTYEGPIYVSRKTQLREVSFVVIGADADTSVLVASGVPIMAKKMSFAAYCKAKGHDDLDKMDAKVKAKMQAAYDAGGSSSEEDDDDPTPKKKKDKTEAKASGDIDLVAMGQKVIDDLRAEAATETGRINAIRGLCATEPALTVEIEANGKKSKVNIQEHAIAAGWDAQKTELEVLRAGRPTTPQHWYSTSQPALSEAVIEAAVLQAGRCELFDDGFYKRQNVPYSIAAPVQKQLKARYTDQVQQSAQDIFKGHIGLQQVLHAGALMNGRRIPDAIRDDSDLEAALHAQNWGIRAEGFSTASIANVLANVLNKALLSGYLFVETAWREFCGIRPVKDFKPTKSINIFGDFQFQQVAPDGNLKHASLSDQAFANQAQTYGRILTINRQNIINDDLGALTTVPMLMGRGAGLKINDVFWTTFLSTATKDDGGQTAFWNATHTDVNGVSIGNSNLSTGAGSALSSAGLHAANLLFRKQVSPDGKPIGMEAALCLVPPELETTLWELLHSSTIVYGGASAAKQPASNRWAGKFRPVISSYLSNSAYTGNSATAYYLLAEPGILPVIEAAFLNGQESPTVQTAQANFNILGIEVRGYGDWGVNMQNFRGGVRSNGV